MSFKFDPGEVLSTKKAMDIVLKAKTAGQPYIERHLKGDFGDVDYQIKRQNKANIEAQEGFVISEYVLNNGTKLGIITDFENQATAFREPGEECSYLLENKKFEEE